MGKNHRLRSVFANKQSRMKVSLALEDYLVHMGPTRKLIPEILVENCDTIQWRRAQSCLPEGVSGVTKLGDQLQAIVWTNAEVGETVLPANRLAA